MEKSMEWVAVKIRNAVVAGMLALGAGVAPLANAQNYTFVDLGTAPGGTHSWAMGINSSGQVVGTTMTLGGGNYIHATLWSNGTARDLGTLPGRSRSEASAINDSGLIVGNSTQAASWSNGGILALGTLGGQESYANDVNGLGQIVGYSYTPGSGAQRATRWSGGNVADLGTLGGVDSEARAINSAGDIVGWASVSTPPGGGSKVVQHASRWNLGGGVTDLGTLGGRNSFANDINDAGDAVGFSSLSGSDKQHATLWSNGTIVDLGTLGDADSFANAINNNGQIVGYAAYVGGILWSEGMIIALNSFLDPVLYGEGWRIGNAVDINDDGFIAVNIYNSLLGQAHAGVLIPAPVPEPETYAMMLAGLGLLGLMARRRKQQG